MMPFRGSESLEQRVREGASAFDFEALIRSQSDSAPSCDLRSTIDRTNSQPENAFDILADSAQKQSMATKRRPFAVTGLTIALLGVLAVGGWGMYFGKSTLAITLPAQKAALTTPPSAPPFSDAGSRAGLPQIELTPGERGPESVPNSPVPDMVRRKVFAAYGLNPDVHRHAVVRLIPAELGGTNGVRNVFPVTPWFAGLKVRLDSFLVEEVRRGRMSLIQAESDLTSNWVKACHVHYIRNYGSADPGKARKKEDQLGWER